MNVHTRWMIRRDMPEVYHIENLCFEYPWTEDEFTRTLRNRNVIALVAVRGDEVVGYVIYGLNYRSLDVLTVAVRPAYFREQIGTALICKLIAKVQHHGRRDSVTAMVRERNIEACRFFQSLGFTADGLVYQPYDSNDEDGIKFVWRKDSKDANIAHDELQYK